MESTAFFEKKINITPADFNKIKTQNIDDILLSKSKDLMENKCSEQGFVLPGSIKLLSRSMGYFEAARFTGDAVYYVKLEGNIIYPADGIRVIGEVIRKNKMGLYVDYRNAIRIQVPRDLHIGNKEYDSVEVGDTIEIELKRSKFQINDLYILASGLFVALKSGISLEQNTINTGKQGMDKQYTDGEVEAATEEDEDSVTEGSDEEEDDKEEEEEDDKEEEEEEDVEAEEGEEEDVEAKEGEEADEVEAKAEE